MTTTTRSTTAPAVTVDRFLAAIAAGAVGSELYAPDAELDAVVPGWRFGCHGAAAIAAEYARWFASPATFEELRRLPVATGEVVEYTLSWVEDGVPHAARHVHLLDIDTEGRIVHEHVWCGGRWSASLLAEMQAASDAE